MSTTKTAAVLAAEIESKGYRGNALLAECVSTIRSLESQVAETESLRAKAGSLQAELQEALRKPRRPAWVLPAVVLLGALAAIACTALVLQSKKMGNYESHIQQLETLSTQQKAAFDAENSTAQQFIASFGKLQTVMADSLNATAASRQAQAEAMTAAQNYAAALKDLTAKSTTTPPQAPGK